MRTSVSIAAATFTLFAAAFPLGAARADDSDWRWARAGVAEHLFAGGSLALAAGIELFIPVRAHRHSRPPRLDAAVRHVLRIQGADGRSAAAVTSDALIIGLLAHTLVDSSLIPLMTRDHATTTAHQMLVMDAESLGAALLVSFVVKHLAGRLRPMPRIVRGESFPSGHTTVAFTLASLECTHHAFVGPYRSRAADLAACLGALGAAVATGVLRIASDRHWATDVLAGASLGAACGFLLPWLLHYMHPRSRAIGDSPDSVDRMAMTADLQDGGFIPLLSLPEVAF